MTRSQSTVIWIGLVLIAFNLIIHIGEIKAVLFGGTSGGAAPSTGNNNSAGAPVPTPQPNAQPTPPNVTAVLWQQRKRPRNSLATTFLQ